MGVGPTDEDDAVDAVEEPLKAGGGLGAGAAAGFGVSTAGTTALAGARSELSRWSVLASVAIAVSKGLLVSSGTADASGAGPVAFADCVVAGVGGGGLGGTTGPSFVLLADIMSVLLPPEASTGDLSCGCGLSC